MNDHTQLLLETTYTKDNLHRKTMLLEEFFGNHFFKEHAEGSVKEHFKEFLLNEQVGEYIRSSLLALPDEFYISFSADNFRDVLQGVREEEGNRSHLTIYVPTVLPPMEIEKLGKWTREHIAPGLFLDIEIDSNVVGGCAFVWNGVHHDYSLRYYIDKHKKEVRSLLKES